MAQLIKIGNSQGVRLPKPLIEQAQLAGKPLRIQLVEGGVLISPQLERRQHWPQMIEMAKQSATVDDALDAQWLDQPNDADEQLEW